MTAATDVIDTVVGAAEVLHRLALGVECLDAVTGRRVRTPVRIGREVDPRLLAGSEPIWPCVTLPDKGIGRASARFDHTTPRGSPPPTPKQPPLPIRLRLADSTRQFVPRRFDVSIWLLEDVLTAEATTPPVPAAARVIRAWLWPGSAAQLPRGTTAIRGVVHDPAGIPVPWARLSAVRTGDVEVGFGQADERGEFTVVIADTGTLPPPAPSDLSIDLVVVAPDPAAVSIATGDPLADLVVESLPRTSNPPLPAELDNPVLRGTATPPGYLPNTAAVPTLTVSVGAETYLTAPVPFSA